MQTPLAVMWQTPAWADAIVDVREVFRRGNNAGGNDRIWRRWPSPHRLVRADQVAQLFQPRQIVCVGIAPR